MEIKDAALYLLILRLISSIALIWVIVRQMKYLRENNPPEEQKIRVALTAVTVVLLGGNLIPIIVDIMTILGDVDRTQKLNVVVGAYAFSNATFAALVGLGWAFFYWVADREKVYLRRENRNLHQEVDELHQTATDVQDRQDVKDVAQKKKDVAQTKKDKAQKNDGPNKKS